MKTNLDFDYNKYDRLSLALKADALEKMLEYYSAFGWEEYERKDDSRYIDIVHVVLYREHKIPNKDKLQLLQLRMEGAVNKFAVSRRDRHAPSLILMLAASIFGTLLIALGALLAIEHRTVPMIITGSFISLVGLITPISIIPKIKRMFKAENERFMLAYREMGAVISRTISAAQRLREDKLENPFSSEKNI